MSWKTGPQAPLVVLMCIYCTVTQVKTVNVLKVDENKQTNVSWLRFSASVLGSVVQQVTCEENQEIQVVPVFDMNKSRSVHPAPPTTSHYHPKMFWKTSRCLKSCSSSQSESESVLTRPSWRKRTPGRQQILLLLLLLHLTPQWRWCPFDDWAHWWGEVSLFECARPGPGGGKEERDEETWNWWREKLEVLSDLILTHNFFYFSK